MAKYIKQAYRAKTYEFAELLMQKKLTVPEFAAGADMALRTAYKIFNGECIQFRTLCKVTAFLDIKPEDYFVVEMQNMQRADCGQSPESKNGAAIE